MKVLALLFTLNFVYFLTPAQVSMNVNLLFQWDDPAIPGSAAYDNAYNEVWGFVQDGREYAVIGSTIGTHIFDVSDPVNSYEAAFIPGADNGVHIIHRDYHDYQGYLYAVSDEGSSTLQIMDLSFLPDSAPVVYDSNALIKTSHNIFIDSSSARLYALGARKGNNSAVELACYSLEYPESPRHMFDYSNVGYFHDAFIRNDTVWGNNGLDGLNVLDFSDTNNLQLIGSLTQYPHQGYNHSGWLNSNGSVYALADETHGKKIKILGVSDLGNIQILDTISSGQSQYSIPHNLIFKDDLLYVSYYYDGLYIFDTSNPSAVTLAGYYDTSTLPHTNSYEGAWGVYPLLPSGLVLVSDMQTGLFVFDASAAVNVKEINGSNYQGFHVFPNPASEYINLVFPPNLKSETLNFNLLGSDGKIIHAGVINNSNLMGRLDLSFCSSGLYFLEIISESVIFYNKVYIK